MSLDQRPDLIVLADRVHTLDPARPTRRPWRSRNGTDHRRSATARRRGRLARHRTPRSSTSEPPRSPPGWSTATSTRCSGIGPDPGRRPQSGVRTPELAGRPLARARPPAPDPEEWVLGWGLDPNAFGGDADHLRSRWSRRWATSRCWSCCSTRTRRSPARPRWRWPGSPARATFDGGAESRLRCRRSPDRAPAGDSRPTSWSRTCCRRSRRAAPPRPCSRSAGRHGRDRTHRRQRDGLRRATRTKLIARAGPGCRPADCGCGSHRSACPEPPRRGWTTSSTCSACGGRRWQVDGVKFMIDGTIDGGTAWLDAARHARRVDGAVLARTRPIHARPLGTSPAQACRRSPTPSVTRGVRYVLDALADTPGAANGGSGAAPHRAHRDDPRGAARRGSAAQNVTASMQPTHCTLYTAADQQRQLVAATRHGARGSSASGPATFVQPGRGSPSARTGRSRRSTPAGCSPTRSCAVRTGTTTTSPVLPDQSL